MEIAKTQDENGIAFKLSGNLNSLETPKLEAELMPAFADANNITLDFTEVNYISSAGMRVLLMGEKTAKAKGGKLTIKNVAPFVMEIFDVTGFSKILSFD